MENRNKQNTIIRWLAVIIAIVIFIFSLTSYSKDQQATEEANDWLQQWSQETQSGLTEQTLETGNPNEKILVIPIEGTMIETDGANPFQTEGYNHDLIIESIQHAIDEPSVMGVLFEVDTPGGGVYESAEITEKIRELKETRNIPIYTSMGNVAASGGYYVSALTDRIYAAEETTTGSIGVILTAMDVSQLLNDWGISADVIKSGEFKDMGSGLREMTDEEREIFQNSIDGMFNRFIDVVDEGRELSRDDIIELADGRVYSGIEAQENGLIDDIGYYEDALSDLSEASGSSNPTVIKLKPTQNAIFSMFPGDLSPFLKQKSDLQIVQEVLQSSQTLRPFYLYGGM